MNHKVENMFHVEVIKDLIETIVKRMEQVDNPVAKQTGDVLRLFKQIAEQGMITEEAEKNGKMTFINMVSRLACDMLAIVAVSQDPHCTFLKMYDFMEEIVINSNQYQEFVSTNNTVH